MSTDNQNPEIPVQTTETGAEQPVREITIEPEIPALDLDEPVQEVPDETATAPAEVKPESKQKVTQEYSINHEEKETSGETLILPSNHEHIVRETLQKLPNVNILDSFKGRDWANVLSEGLTNGTMHGVFTKSLEADGADFSNRIEHNGISLMGAAPRIKKTENAELQGERAIVRLISHLGLGTLYQVPLWHSGFWVTLKPPTESELVELNRLMISDKIKMGRYSYGMAYSNMTAYTVDRIIDFIVKHIYDMTVKHEDINVSNVRDHISTLDMNALIHGFATTMYPRGFRYRRACCNNPDKCQHVVEDTLNLTKLQWVNRAALTDWQKNFMSGRSSKQKTSAEVSRYRDELASAQKRRVVLNEGKRNEIAFVLKTPSLNEYVNSGHRWIGDIVETVNSSMSVEASTEERNSVITQHGQATAMRQYAHWIESIELDSNVIKDNETIEMTLNTVSQDDDIRSGFITEVVNYINSSTISVIGIPVYDCPNCGTTQESPVTLPRHTGVIPLDTIQVFFDLLLQRIARMGQR